MQSQLSKILRENSNYASVLSQEILNQKPHVFDLSKNNAEFAKVELSDIDAFTSFINNTLAQANAIYGVGGYGEDRIMYRHSKLFTSNNEEPRSVHLAVDLWVTAGTEVYSPLPAIVHSFQINEGLANYGPTIILEHELSGTKFYTLYGHLTRTSLDGLAVGQTIEQGQQIATVGASHENGQWPPHLHFQIISDMLGKTGDFPGVAKPSEKDYWLTLCPNPNLILKIASL